MNWQGWVLVILTLVFVSGQIVAHNWIKNVTNSYFFWLAVGAFCFAWLMAFRFAGHMSDFWAQVRAGTLDNPGSYDQSFIISKGLLLDICPMCAFLLPIACMVDPSRKAARIIAPSALLAGAFTVCSLIADSDAALTTEFIFFGIGQNKCYFIMHFFQVVLGVGILLNTPRFGKKGWLMALAFILGIYTYVGICRLITGAAWFVSGLSYNDWESGEYYKVAQVLHWPPKICPYIGIPTMIALGCGIVALKDYPFSKGWFKYGNAYSGKWYSWYNYNKFEKEKWF